MCWQSKYIRVGRSRNVRTAFLFCWPVLSFVPALHSLLPRPFLTGEPGGSWWLLPLLLLSWFLLVPCRLCPGLQPSRETCSSCPGAAVPLEESVCSVVGPSSGCNECLLQHLDLLLLHLLPVLGVSSYLPCLLFAPPPSLWRLLPMSCLPRGAAEGPALPCGCLSGGWLEVGPSHARPS